MVSTRIVQNIGDKPRDRGRVAATFSEQQALICRFR
jgi:hypothetical protein